MLATDNSPVMSYVNKQGSTQSPSILYVARASLLWCHDQGIFLRARHIPGKLNVLADSLSRAGQIHPREWSLSPQVFSRLCLLWGTSWNHKLPQFLSNPRSSSLASGLPVHELGFPVRVCIHSYSSYTSRVANDQILPVSDYSGLPVVAGQVLVSRPAGSSG